MHELNSPALYIAGILNKCYFSKRLTLYRNILTFDDLEKEAFGKNCGKMKKMLVTSISQGCHKPEEIRFPDNSLTKFENSLTYYIAVFGLSVITLDILRKFKIYNFSLKGDVGLHPPLSKPSPGCPIT